MIIKKIRYLNMSNYAKIMAEYHNAITIIILDVQREKVFEIPDME